MSKEKFKFNQKTLQFEKVELSVKQKFKQLGIHLGFSMTLAGLVIVLSFPLVSQMIGRKDKATNEKLKTEYNALNSKIHQLNEELAVLRLRDDSIYSGVFGVKPIAKSLLVGGTGGSDKLEHLRGYGSNSDLMLTSGKQLLQLEAKIKIHQSRFKKIENLSRTRLGKLAAIPAVQPIHNHNLIRTSSGFGMRMHPVYGVEKMHTGIDFTAAIGTEIHSTGDGVVKEVVNESSGYGKHVVVQHGYGYQTLYAHMSNFTVKVGQKVKRGELIGYVGNTGTSTAAHLHYEVIKNGHKVDPAHYFFNDLTFGEYSEMVKISSAITTSMD